MPREDIVEVFLMLLCWTPMNLTGNAVMILGTLSMLFSSFFRTLNEFNFP
jgi:hypothetical protein